MEYDCARDALSDPVKVVQIIKVGKSCFLEIGGQYGLISSFHGNKLNNILKV